MPIPKVYTIAEVSKHTRAPIATVRSWIYTGKLKSIKIGRKRLISETEVLRLFNTQEHA